MGEATEIEFLAGKDVSPFDSETFESLSKGLQISIIKLSDIKKYSYCNYLFSPYFYMQDKLNSWEILSKNSDLPVNNYFFHIKDTIEEVKEEAICYDLTHALSKFIDNDEKIDSLNSMRKIAKENDFVISRLRSYLEEMGVVTQQNKLQLFSTEFLVFRSKTKKVSTCTLFAFCMTKFVQTILNRSQYGTQHPRFYEFVLENMPIPNCLFIINNEIETIIKQSHQKQNQSKELYKQAEQILSKELNLTHFEPKDQLTFTITKKEIDEAGRFDAEYFQPKYKKIIEKIENYKGGGCEVREILNWKKGVEVGSEEYLDEGLDFGRVSDFSKFGFDKVTKKISKKLFDELKVKFQPREDEILFTKDGTIGISYLLKKDFEGVLSSAFLRLTLKEKYKNFQKECLTLILNSILCRTQVEKLSGGALINHLKPSDFEKFKIPLISQNIQNQIAKEIEESHHLRKESKALLEQAKTKVEQEIERKYKKR